VHSPVAAVSNLLRMSVVNRTVPGRRDWRLQGPGPARTKRCEVNTNCFNFGSALVSSQTVQMAEQGLDALCSDGSRNATASDDDGGSGFYPSHGGPDMHKKNAVEDSADEASDSTRSSINARMAERHARIRKHKLKRRGLDDSEEEESEQMFGRTPYRRLAMSQKFTPPRKKPKIVVDDSAESLRSVSANENSEEDQSGDDDDVALAVNGMMGSLFWH
jgi:hypothetical protein